MVATRDSDHQQTFTVTHRGNHYNIRNFLQKYHPGGFKWVKPYEGKDITKSMEKYHHSKNAYYILREYKKGGRDSSKNDSDEDLESMVDWSKPMVSQVGALGTKYQEWVMLPVDRKLILFGNPILENLTKTPLYMVPLFWIPVLTCFFAYGWKELNWSLDLYSCLHMSLSTLIGVVMSTLVEYAFHRWIFHSVPSGENKMMIYIHFFIHGLHHKAPFDPRTTVIPPVATTVLAYLFYLLYSVFLARSVVFFVMTGMIMGYITYELTHYYMHFGAPNENSYFHYLKRIHNQHHFNHHDKVFGVSNMFWDTIFNSLVELKKLHMPVKW
ncbi:hypothetical protein Zmor_027441 [Zophobas morio]|uniref:Fatty acid 2-hydroxylase n=1 Tax=Zophobas morio TaxID=2755281 RepID=A0AA38HN85_9CUCU|nr:hypothetical protein Zmor_027441 [Zophobas morio]